MKLFIRILAAVIISSFITGCIESTTLIKVNKDGTGTITVREYYSPQVMSMLDGFQGVMREMDMTFEDEEGVTHSMNWEVEGPANLFEEQIQSRLDQFGSGVTLKSSFEETNDRGWNGFRAVYTIEDVSQVKMGGVDMAESGNDAVHYSFDFIPGDVSILHIIPSEHTRGDLPSDDDKHVDEDIDMLGGMEAMFGAMFQGMRVRMLLQIDGFIVETNAEYPTPYREDEIILMDLEFDRFLDNPEALKLLMAEDPDAIHKLKEKDISGIMAESPDKTIKIHFQ